MTQEEAQLRNKLKTAECERDELKAVLKAPDDYVIMSRSTYKRMMKAERVCEAIDGRHPIAVGDRVGALLDDWRNGAGAALKGHKER